MIPTSDQIAEAAAIVAESHSCAVADVVGRSKYRLHSRARAAWCGWMSTRGLRPADMTHLASAIERDDWPTDPLEWHAAAAAVKRFHALNRTERQAIVRHIEERLACPTTD